MNRRLLLCLLFCLLLGPVVGTPAVHVHAQASPAYEVIDLINQVRARYALPPFQINPTLMAVAQAHTEWMAANGSYTHVGAGGSTPQDRASAAGYAGRVAENIVGGTLMTPARGVQWWENSAIHFANMTSSRHTEIGVGYAFGNDQHFYTMLIGQPTGVVVQPRPPGEESAGPVEDEDDLAPLFVVEPVVVAEPREDGSVVHVVGPGQTAWDIAVVYGVELDELLALNAFPETPLLVPGQEVLVRLPPGVTPTPIPTPTSNVRPDGSVVHEVRTGETAWSIAQLYNMSVNDLLRLNALPDDPILLPGQEVLIRPPIRPTSAPDEPLYHTVQAGDTAWAIAARYGVAVDDLLALNGLPDDPILQPGDELLVRPAATLTPTPDVVLSPAFTAVAAEGTSPPPPAITVSPTVTPIPLPTDTPKAATPAPAPTLALTPSPPPPSEEAATDLGQLLIVGGIVCGVGLAGIAGLAAVVGILLERRR